MKTLLVLLVAAALAVGGYFAYGQYEYQQLIGAITPHVKNASLRVANSARYETDPDSNITFKELFQKLEADIAEVDKQLIEVQTLSNPKTAAHAEPAVAYLKAAQEYLRAMLLKDRKTLALSSASRWANRQLDEYRDASGYSVEYASKAADKAIEEFREAEREFNATIPALLAAAKKLKEARRPLTKLLPGDALIVESQIDAVIAKNSPKADTK